MEVAVGWFAQCHAALRRANHPYRLRGELGLCVEWNVGSGRSRKFVGVLSEMGGGKGERML